MSGIGNSNLTIMLLGNQIQHYEWGRRKVITHCGRNGEGATCRPEAELWMGAHPKAPSWVDIEGRHLPLTDLIAECPCEVLGGRVTEKCGSQLPFLMKLLAAGRPLSIQAHPDKKLARIGFGREEAEGIPIDDKRRNYRDANPKPEVICALGDFWALKGFRRIDSIVDDFKDIAVIRPEWNAFEKSTDADGLQEFFHNLVRLDEPRRQALVGRLVFEMQNRKNAHPHAKWIIELDKLYPNDIGVAIALMLNLVELKKWQTLSIPAGELHAYLKGVGVELMANSDNVLRAGLTPKHIDIDGLLEIVDFRKETNADPHGPPDCDCPGQDNREYEVEPPPDCQEFRLSMFCVRNEREYRRPELKDQCVEMLFVAEGDATIKEDATGESLTVGQGKSVLIPAAVREYDVTCGAGEKAVILKATVP